LDIEINFSIKINLLKEKMIETPVIACPWKEKEVIIKYNSHD
jgi:hypothetical protein